MVHPRTGYPAAEGQSAKSLFCLWKEPARPGPLERGSGEGHEVMDVGLPHPGDCSDQVERRTLIVIGLEGEAKDEVNDRDESVLLTEVDGMDDILNGVPPVQEAEHPVAA